MNAEGLWEAAGAILCAGVMDWDPPHDLAGDCTPIRVVLCPIADCIIMAEVRDRDNGRPLSNYYVSRRSFHPII